MGDLLARLESLRAHILECEAIRDAVADNTKRELFTKLAKLYRTLASEVEGAVNGQASLDTLSAASQDTFLGRKTYEPFPWQDDKKWARP